MSQALTLPGPFFFEPNLDLGRLTLEPAHVLEVEDDVGHVLADARQL